MAEKIPAKQHTRPGQFVADFPRRHLILAASVLTLLFFSLLLTPSKPAEANRISQELTLTLSSTEAVPDETEAAAEVTPEQQLNWLTETIKKGDNLSSIFQRVGLSAREVYDIVNSSKEARQLTRIFPGQQLAFLLDNDGQLTELRHIHNKLESTLYQRQDDSKYRVTTERREPALNQRFSSATIESSLYLAAEKNGLPENLIMELANIFGGVIDFVYDVRAGDNFNIIYEEQILDGEKIGTGPILAAQFTNQGQTYYAYRYEDANGEIGYFNEQGVSMRKAFLRAPLDFTRISSSFNLKRLHPIFKTSRPHRGIDYAAPTGTPVYAAGDGRVVASGYTKANGNYVVISHGGQYTTKYLHLQKRAVKNGQKVKQRRIIGWVGSTGYATGPHLHYEFLVNGVHRNPRTILRKLPKAESIAAADKGHFLQQISGLQMQLATLSRHNRQLATADTDNTKNTL